MRAKSASEKAFEIALGIFFVVFCLSIIYPFWNLILTSFSTPDSLSFLGFRLWISEWSVASYKFAVSEYGNAPVGYANSIFRVAVGSTVTIVMTMLFAFPLSKRDLPGRTVITLYILITMFFSGGIIPLYLLVRRLGLMNSRLALILPAMTNGFYIILTRNFLMTLDVAYEESAMMDGAGYVQVMTRIIIPLSKPIIAVLLLWSAVFHWNEWFHAILFIKARSKWVLQFILRRMLENMHAVKAEMLTYEEDINMMPSEAVQAAVTVLTIGPIILVYPFIQKYFVKGVFVGSLKG